jgi:hypothetical protein
MCDDVVGVEQARHGHQEPRVARLGRLRVDVGAGVHARGGLLGHHVADAPCFRAGAVVGLEHSQVTPAAVLAHHRHLPLPPAHSGAGSGAERGAHLGAAAGLGAGRAGAVEVADEHRLCGTAVREGVSLGHTASGRRGRRRRPRAGRHAAAAPSLCRQVRRAHPRCTWASRHSGARCTLFQTRGRARVPLRRRGRGAGCEGMFAEICHRRWRAAARQVQPVTSRARGGHHSLHCRHAG